MYQIFALGGAQYTSVVEKSAILELFLLGVSNLHIRQCSIYSSIRKFSYVIASQGITIGDSDTANFTFY